MVLAPSNDHALRLVELFSYPWRFITASLTGESKASWRTETKYPLRPRALWARWQDAGQLIGVRFGSETRYALIDIDAGSPYFRSLQEIKGALETIGIVRTIPIRSSFSGGIHLYCPLPESVNTYTLALALRECLDAQGFKLKQGQLETFPNCKSYGKNWLNNFTEYNGHRLPLQPGTGSVLLADDCSSPAGDSLALFFARWDNCAQLQDMQMLREALSQAKRVSRGNYAQKAVTKAVEWRTDLEIEISEGWTAPGQTNGLLKAIACYARVFEALAGDELTAYIERLCPTLPGFDQFCSHKTELRSRAIAWAKAAEKFYWPLGTEPQRETLVYSHNAQSAADAQRRIRSAASQLRFTSGGAVRKIVEWLCHTARCSVATLYKYRELWHPDQRGVTADSEQVSAHFDGATGEVTAIAGMPDPRTVTPCQRFNEGCNPDDLSEKHFYSGEREGCRGEGGVFHNGSK